MDACQLHLKKTSQNSSEHSKVIRIDYESHSLHSEIAQILKHMVMQSVSQLKITPQVGMAHEPTSHKGGRRKAKSTTNTSMGGFSVCFQLPADCIINKIDMDKEALIYQNFILSQVGGKFNLTRQFSFRERLEGWSIVYRQRENGPPDVFYHHSKSGRMFRFVTEIVNYLQFEFYYDDNHISKMITPQGDLVKHISEGASTVKRKRKPTSGEGTKRQKALSDKQENDIEKLRKRNTSKSQGFPTAAEENADKMEANQITDATIIKVGDQSAVESQVDGSLEVMIEIYKNAKIDQKEVKYEYPSLHEISMDWATNDGLLDAYYDACDLIYHIPICKNVGELIEFLVTERNKGHG